MGLARGQAAALKRPANRLPVSGTADAAVRRASAGVGTLVRSLRCCRIVTFGVAALLAGCVSGVAVSITNRSAVELVDVLVSGKGFADSAGAIPAGATQTIRVHPRGESGVKIAFSAGGQRYSAENGYIEDDILYGVLVTVDADFSVKIDTSLR